MLDDIFCRTGTSAPTMVGRRLDLVERLEFKFDQENSVLEVMVVVMVFSPMIKVFGVGGQDLATPDDVLVASVGADDVIHQMVKVFCVDKLRQAAAGAAQSSRLGDVLGQILRLV